MTRIEALQYGESLPMPETINGKKKDLEMVYVSLNGFEKREDALADLHNFCRLHDTAGGWVKASNDAEGIFQATDNQRFYAYTHRGKYI